MKLVSFNPLLSLRILMALDPDDKVINFQSSSEFKKELNSFFLPIITFFQSSSEFKYPYEIWKALAEETFNPLLSLSDLGI